MKIRQMQEWAIEEFTPEEARKLQILGWKWVDQDTNSPLFGHFSTYDKRVLDMTMKLIKGNSIILEFGVKK